MGISGLLPMLKEIQVHGHISEFRGKRLAVDAYVWLHKGAFGCAEKIVKGEKTTRFVDYAMHRVRLLRHFGITPYIVFDGGPLPAKKGTEVSRAKSRAESLAKAQSLESQGRTKEARDHYTKCLDITPEMAYQLIKALRAEHVDYVVAPYEADAQLCFLEREGFVDGIITEDSDLLVFGCKHVIFKLDGNGQCVSIHRDKFSTLNEFPMHGWTDLQFRRMAMLSGCDYLPSISGIGVKTAHRLLRRYKTVEKLLQSIRLEGTHNIPPSYAADFAQAELAFIHQRVFHPLLQRLVPLNDFPEQGLQEDDEKWIGLDVSVEVARGMAKGDLHPETREPIEDQWPDYKPAERPHMQRSTSTPKNVLQNSSKGNMVSAGPMDAFISRTKRTKSMPLPQPIGRMSSGPSRLSDQHLFTRQAPEIAEAGPSQPRKSKFFSSRKMSDANRLEEAVRAEAADMTWEDSDEAAPDVAYEAGPSRSSPPLESLRSPSPFVSPIRDEESLPRTEHNEETQLTSPCGSRCSTPPVSSPIRDERDELEEDTFSPQCARLATYPTSPTRDAVDSIRSTQVLVATSSQAPPPIRCLVQTPNKERRPLSQLHSVLIPASSPMTTGLPLELRNLSGLTGVSSDSIEEEEVVTPSAEVLGKRKRAIDQDTRRRKQEVKEDVIHEFVDQEHEELDVERQREERAKVVAAGWKAKFALNSKAAFPRPRTTRVNSGRKNGSDPIFSPPSKKVLTPRQPNVPVVQAEPRRVLDEKATPTPMRSTVETKRISPLNQHDPSNMVRSSLERFKFTGKVNMD